MNILRDLQRYAFVSCYEIWKSTFVLTESLRVRVKNHVRAYKALGKKYTARHGIQSHYLSVCKRNLFLSFSVCFISIFQIKHDNMTVAFFSDLSKLNSVKWRGKNGARKKWKNVKIYELGLTTTSVDKHSAIHKSFDLIWIHFFTLFARMKSPWLSIFRILC